jgi:sugar phosphate isomerase/epimerase
MIYISTSCVKNKSVKESIKQIADYGYTNIELSGGTDYYPELVDDLVFLKNRYKLNLICHNYFPPPKEHFVLNLASLDLSTQEKSFKFLKDTIKLSDKLKIKEFGFHAGFFLNIPLNEIGKKIQSQTLFNKQEAIAQFCKSYIELNNQTKSKLYIENNVISRPNYEKFGQNIFMLTSSKDYFALKKLINFDLILDVAHLKVSCNSLNLNFEEELDILIHETDYIHISDNSGFTDDNIGLKKDSKLYSLLSNYSLKNKKITLEVYDNSFKEIEKTYNLISDLI